MTCEMRGRPGHALPWTYKIEGELTARQYAMLTGLAVATSSSAAGVLMSALSKLLDMLTKPARWLVGEEG